MADGWLSPGSIMGAAGIVLSAASLTYTRRVDRRGRSSDRPIVNIELSAPNANGWQLLWISMENHTTGVWILEKMTFPRAADALAAKRSDALVDNGRGGFEEKPPQVRDSRPGPS